MLTALNYVRMHNEAKICHQVSKANIDIPLKKTSSSEPFYMDPNKFSINAHYYPDLTFNFK